MSAPVLAFLGPRCGAGKPNLLYHLAWMFARLGRRVLAADLDPQARLTAAFLSESEREGLWRRPVPGATVFRCIGPEAGGGAPPAAPVLKRLDDNLFLLPGDVALSRCESVLAAQWADGGADAGGLCRRMRILSSFWRALRMGMRSADAELALVDVGAGLGAVSRSALIAADYAAVILDADLFSLQGLRSLGPALRGWRDSWARLLARLREGGECGRPGFNLPGGGMAPIGYLFRRPEPRLDGSALVCGKWAGLLPSAYREHVLGRPAEGEIPSPDPECLAMLSPYRALIPMGRERRKPIFELTLADGAGGCHALAVRRAGADFRRLAGDIAAKIRIRT